MKISRRELFAVVSSAVGASTKAARPIHIDRSLCDFAVLISPGTISFDINFDSKPWELPNA